jgi:hypothetical protein
VTALSSNVKLCAAPGCAALLAVTTGMMRAPTHCSGCAKAARGAQSKIRHDPDVLAVR